MVRTVAITASLEMSSQVGRGAQDIGGKRKFQRGKIQVARRSQISGIRFRSAFAGDRLQQAGYALKGAEGHDEHGAALDNECDVARHQIELAFRRCV